MILRPARLEIVWKDMNEWGFSHTARDSFCKNALHMQINQNFGSPGRTSRPFYFPQSQALSSILDVRTLQWLKLSNTFLFDLPSSLFITEDSVRFQNHFLKSCGRMPRSSRLLNCFLTICGRFQAIEMFGKAPITVSMITMFWFRCLRHLVP